MQSVLLTCLETNKHVNFEFSHFRGYARIPVAGIVNNMPELEGCIDDERQFNTAKPSQVPGDATVLKRFFPR